ncbi:uncharacterized protein IL334_005338 [Kwoniella shivajii]|uniref:Uncharacterized protein n=1 Tax=Kwoniella shivajii TaxID=564305 RepID=A0ABZ1D2W2_9TREE|nr:hypothetical protein IL334_005338 [Kwoniella shivajii]
MSAPSPTPSNVPAAHHKRPRPSAAAGPSAPQGSSISRTKRRKPEGPSVDDTDKRNGVNGKSKEDDAVDPAGDVKTKIDFNELPVETLYKYLEYHDLLPRWDVSPWSEEPCTPPNQLYTLPPAAPIVPLSSSSNIPVQTRTSTSPIPQTSNAAFPNSGAGQEGDSSMSQGLTQGSSQINGIGKPTDNGDLDTLSNIHDEPQLPQLPPSATNSGPSHSSQVVTARIDDSSNAQSQGQSHGQAHNQGINDNSHLPKLEQQLEEGGEGNPLDPFEPPTTRSKTLPTRQPEANSPIPEHPAVQLKRGVITLSDVYSAREVLAEKANNHWMKGLGGGQNKEGETIVNFLYKMKVGQGRLLRVYNPVPANQHW